VISLIIDIKVLRAAAKICCVPIMVLLVIAALGPGKWTARTALGWQFDHFIGYFGIALFFCFARGHPFVVGGIIMALAAVLEGLQVFTPDRSAIFRQPAMAQAERWRRLPLLRSSSEHGDGALRWLE
jgi:hypothetical protein